MARSTGIWSQLITFEPNKMEPWVAFRAALGMALAVGIGFMMNSPAVGLSIAIGALNVCYSDKSDAYIDRAKRMIAASVLSAVFVFLAAWSANEPVLVFVLLTCIAFFSGMLVVLDTVIADLSVICLATFLIFSAQALDAGSALHLSLFAFIGGLLQAVIGIGLWPWRRYRPARRALSAFFQDIARLTSTSGTAEQAPQATHLSIEAQNALKDLAGDSRADARRYRSLLAQAERLRLTILSLLRLRKRLSREIDQHFSVSLLDDILKSTAKVLDSVGEVIQTSQSIGVAPPIIVQIENQITQIKNQRSENESAFLNAVLNDLTYQMDMLAGQLRAVADLSLRTTAVGIQKAEQIEASKPIKMRFRGSLATLRANLTFKSPGFRHAVRLSLCIAIGEILSKSLNLHRAYWVPMTIAIVLKPDYAATFNRGMLRVLGTLAGLVIATVLFHIFPETQTAEFILIVLFTFLMRWVGSANYGIFAMCVGALVVVLIALTGVSPKEVIWARGLNTFMGGAIALIVYLLWPTSEKLQLSEVIARMLETYLEYFKAVVAVIKGHSGYSDQDMDRIRQTSRVARTSFQAASGRYTLERGANFEDLKVISAITVASNRFAHSMMSMEAGSSQRLSDNQKEAFKEFAAQIEKTVTLLVECLRGKDIPQNEFPDVRQAYVKLVESREKEGEQFSVIFEEADRMANSLITLTEHVRKRLVENKINNRKEVPV
ncbi:FUSC family protein [Bdellovibrio sp. NC01]|uniref:FUSC family protein n=1 Tax=Bdellovibrio sp. NC01 TaxID=2220073 RepID=UPI0011592780|nr:FUSC family protein [Bdellovibrio sp. NC01]QDK38012.1 hypothetical protein DOE51_10640 [Bdellovibrio sp. NC01]